MAYGYKGRYRYDYQRGDYVHRIRAREMLGREIPSGYEVHHVDHDPWNDAPRVAAMPAWVHREHHSWQKSGYDFKICWNCGRPGHWARNCYLLQVRLRSISNTTAVDGGLARSSISHQRWLICVCAYRVRRPSVGPVYMTIETLERAHVRPVHI